MSENNPQPRSYPEATPDKWQTLFPHQSGWYFTAGSHDVIPVEALFRNGEWQVKGAYLTPHMYLPLKDFIARFGQPLWWGPVPVPNYPEF